MTLENIITKEILNELYVNQQLSMARVAKQLNCGETVIWNYMKKYNIPRRPKSQSLKGKKQTLEHRQKLADTRHKNKIGVGESNHNWNGGTSSKINERCVTGLTYWKNSVKRRDKFTCQICDINGEEGCKCCGHKPTLHVHHLKSWKDHPELRLNIDNGITLCEKCHRGIDRISGLIAGNSLN